MDTPFTFTEFTNLLEMFNSPDEENHILAASLLDVKGSVALPELLMCIKFSKKDETFWATQISWVHSTGTEVTKPTYEEILNNLLFNNRPMEFIIFFFAQYSQFLTNIIQQHDLYKSCSASIEVR